MTDVAPPEQPGWYADAAGAWWWWDGRAWTSAAAAVPGPGTGVDPAVARSQERTMAMVMWIVFLVGGGWIGALVFYVVAKDKAFVRHHAAEALNLTLTTIIPQLLALGLLVPYYLDILTNLDGDTPPVTNTFVVGLVLLLAIALATYAVAIVAIVRASRGRWWRIPLPFHPVRGVVGSGEEPYSVS